MRIKREPKPIEIKCIDCPTIFIAYSKKAKRCPVCRKKRARAQSKKSMEYLRQHRNPTSEKQTCVSKKLTIGEILIGLENYNQKHRTRLSYGQYVALVDK